MSEQSFPAPVVRELREQAKRFRIRARFLESIMIRREVADAAARAGLSFSAVSPDAISRVFVDDAGVVRGAAEAVSISRV